MHTNVTMPDYEEIRSELLKTAGAKNSQILFEDPDFPPVQTSVFYHQKSSHKFSWKRPKEIKNYENPVFLLDGLSQFDVSVGPLGDRWLVTAFGVLHSARGLFYRVVPADQSFTDQYCGLFRFRLWWCGEWTEVLVDDALPVVDGRLMFIQSQQTKQFWPSLLEKAYAKLHGSYEAIKYGNILDGLANLTGGAAESVPITPDSCNLVFNTVLNKTSIVTCAALSDEGGLRNFDKLHNGILLGCNYRLLNIERVQAKNAERHSLLRLQSPWGTSDYTHPPMWDDYPLHEKDRLGVGYVPEGEFWMTEKDFLATFTHFELIHLDGDTSLDEPSLRNKQPWTMRVWEGRWQKGVTAGGCRNNVDTFHINPQFLLIAAEEDEIIISIHQHVVLSPLVVGFSVYAISSVGGRLDAQFFKKHHAILHSAYTNTQQVTSRCRLQPGQYVIIPTSFEAGQEAAFTLRVYSSVPVNLGLLDDVPAQLKPVVLRAANDNGEKVYMKVFEAAFLQLADERKTISAFDLAELLDAVLPNDYVKSCATSECCREVVLAFNPFGGGRLTFQSFRDFIHNLRIWQSIFKTHCNGAVLPAEKLKDALADVGFKLNSDILSLLMLRHMRKEGLLRFGDFITCILHLQTAFSIFNRKDPSQVGYVKMTMTEWLRSSLRC
ncbi:calpain-C-like [Paramacrobiotus metropolitanus]|uniref:calpain-C-like n=1 Tax=Paramacrobiotus metropolitanus TaxID=2943436 RepID=UPI002446453F|nr:calpain-C-like [Paramacrobiotus metropolitanus]